MTSSVKLFDLLIELIERTSSATPFRCAFGDVFSCADRSKIGAKREEHGNKKCICREAEIIWSDGLFRRFN